MPVLSVCMITYNHEKYIRKAIEGVLMQQTDFEIELVIGNDCSTDATGSIIQEMIQNHPNGSKIKYFSHTQNKGMMPNFRFIMERCTGKYAALCDGDDYWTDPQKLQKQVVFLENHPDYVLSFHKTSIENRDGTITEDFITTIPEGYETIETLARHGNYIHTPSVVFRNVIRELPFELEFSPVGDFFLYLLLAEQGKLYYFSEPMAVYRYQAGVFSTQSGFKTSTGMPRFYSCVLACLKNENARKIIFERQIKALENYEKRAKYEFSSNQFLSENKSYTDILKVFVKKILKLKPAK